MTNKNKIILDISRYFLKINNKLNRLEKRSVDFGTGERLFASELHTIQTIGEKRVTNVTELCNLSGVTKGAVSQIISKLEKKNYITKERDREFGKEKNIILTKKGQVIFKAHEEMHRNMDKEILQFMNAVSNEELSSFLKILVNLEKYIDRFINR